MQSSILFRASSLLASLALILASGCSTVPAEPPLATTTPAVAAPVVVTPAEQAPHPTLVPGRFSDLPGWSSDRLSEAWPALLSSCQVLVRREVWREVCQVAADLNMKDEAALRLFFESFFIPHRVFNGDGTGEGLVTGYYEPLLQGSRKKGGRFQIPLHREPPDLLTVDMSTLYPELRGMRLRGRVVGNKVVPYFSRAEMMAAGVLNGHELVWVDDPIEAFFLQVQGSGRVHLADAKETVRLAYANQNGHPYRSIGRYLVDQGEMTLEQASAQSIKGWYSANPARREELLNANPSYVFFREEKVTDPSVGPKGALGVPLTPLRSIAVDPRFVPLGAPVFLDSTYPGSKTALQRLVVAQDTGGAIKGAVRADYFWGFGKQAGEQAGRMKQRGVMWVLLPKGYPMNGADGGAK